LKALDLSPRPVEYTPGGFAYLRSQVEVSVIGIEVNRALAEPILESFIQAQAA
jgi:hypothetical protein